jgi:starch synthase
LDEASFNPESDEYLEERFTAATLEKRVKNKTELQRRLGLEADAQPVLLGMVGRINHQKGIDIALRCMQQLQGFPWQLILLGSGDANLEAEACELQNRYPDQVRIMLGYDEGLGRMIYGGADIFLMPSRYEPCGLAQMIAMRYGSVPVVRATGGLKDTVQEGETGILFEQETPEAMREAISRAVLLFSSKDLWQKVQTMGMSRDFSWSNSARKYRDIYLQLVS